jgi:hypothetical protein
MPEPRVDLAGLPLHRPRGVELPVESNRLTRKDLSRYREGSTTTA